MNSYDQALSLGFALGCMATGLIATVLWLNREAADKLPSNPDWPENPLRPLPELLATQCQDCRRVRCVDRTWQHEATVPLPTGCRVSHGLCPGCERGRHAEIDAMLPAVKPA